MNHRINFMSSKKSAEEKLYLTGYIDVPADRLDAVTEALPLHIELTLAEPGCISFEIEPSNSVPGRFMVSEVFKNQAAFEAHQIRNRSSAWFKVTEGIPRNFSIKTGEDNPS